MKLQKVRITFERSIEIEVYAPEDADADALASIAAEIADGDMRDWDPTPWNAFVGPSQFVEVSDDQRALGPPNKYGFRSVVKGSPLAQDAVLVLSDAADDFVCPEDATWWVAE